MDVTAPVPVIVVMGASGAGKSTIGRRLSGWLGVPFVDGDDLHPPANRAKMAAGVPLDDRDREPWLDAIVRRIRSAAEESGAVIACSALRRTYRDRFAGAGVPVWFVHLAVDPDTAARRMAQRPDHFMPPKLAESQQAALEPLAADEPGVTVDASASRDSTFAAARRSLEGLGVSTRRA